MRYLDMENWSRREHFELFNTFDQPYFGLCANVDLTDFHPYVKRNKLSMTAAIVYVISRAANAVPEFRYRIRDGKVVEHEVVHPSTTILISEDVFSFCTLEYSDSYEAFAATMAEAIEFVKQNLTLNDEPGRDDRLYLTAIPWVSFTSFKHPLNLQRPDSVPRFAYGKFSEEGGRLKMPLAVQGHHAVMDGLHAGRFYAEMEGLLNHPGSTLST